MMNINAGFNISEKRGVLKNDTKEENFYNIDDQDSGIFRELGEGLSTRIFPASRRWYQWYGSRQTQRGHPFP